MSDFELLQNVILYLKKYGLEVEFVSNDDDKVAIAELSQHKILVNTSSRDTLGMIFTIAHLFGHYIQFANIEKYKALILKVKEEPKPLNLDSDFRQQFYNYEKEAFQIGKKLLECVQAFDEEIERKYQIFFETDFDLFWQYLTLGIQQSPEAFNLELKHRYRTDLKKRLSIIPLGYPKEHVYLHNISLIVY